MLVLTCFLSYIVGVIATCGFVIRLYRRGDIENGPDRVSFILRAAILWPIFWIMAGIVYTREYLEEVSTPIPKKEIALPDMSDFDSPEDWEAAVRQRIKENSP